jgi:hypothetical protein
MEIRNKIKIGNKFYSIGTLKVLTGEETIKPRKINKNFLLIAEAIDDPNNFPFLLGGIYNIAHEEEIRLGLARVQVDSKLKMKEDLEAYNTRLYVAEAIEKLLFGDLIIEGNGERDNTEEIKEQKKPSKRSTRKKK